MLPLIAFATGMTIGKLRLVGRSTSVLLQGILAAFLIALFIGVVSPTQIITPEMAARGNPSFMDMAVARNAFGRQRESFEADLTISGLSGDFRGVFIRAPAITRVWGDCSVLSRLEDTIVMARQEARFGLTFHPELWGDARIHEIFVESI